MLGSTRRRVGAFACVGGAALLFFPWPSGGQANGRGHLLDPFTFGNPAFCTPKGPVRDFGFSKLPPVHEVPESGEPLGHPAVDIYGGSRFTQVMPRPQEFGYGFSEHNYGGTVLVDWTVTAQLWAVTSDGERLNEVDNGQLFIGRLNAAHQPGLYLTPPTRRGFYRFDIQFANRSGDLLGSYSAYLRVVRPFWKARLGLSGRTFHPGALVLSRVENFGTETVMYGEDFSVQRFENDSWAHVPDLARGPWFMWLGAAGPGASGRCSALRLPNDVAPGQYRIVKEVGRPPWPNGKRSRHLTARFDVAGP